jgi:superfamily I DNA/RNA helicase/RecB family exonuclease
MSVPHGCVLLVVTGISRKSAVKPAIELDPAQIRLVGHTGSPLLCLAGPGTGKTTAILEAVCARTADCRPLVLTFSRAAAEELRERLAARLGEGLLPTVSTFHSFAYSIVREFGATDAFGRAPRLLGGAEQEQRLRELLTYAVKEGRIPWPPELAAAIGTAGLAKQVRLLLSRAQLLGFGPDELAAVARNAGMPEWEALADFLGEYLDVFEALGVLDYSELIGRAVGIVSEEAIAAQLRSRYPAIYVDEYQDTDYAQVQLLQAITSATSTLVAVGDPDQAIYGFRGADVGGILRFCDDFPVADGSPAPILVLRDVRRFGSTIGSAALRVINRVGLGTLSAAVRRDHRMPRYGKPARDGVDVLTFDSVAAQAGGVADRIRRVRLHGEVAAWSDIAVIVRSRSDIPNLQHALDAAAIPVDIDSADQSLASNRAVSWLLDVLATAADPSSLSTERALSLLSCAPISLDALAYRSLVRALRREGGSRGGGANPSAMTSDELVRSCLIDPAQVPRGPEQLSGFWRLADMVEQTRADLAQGTPVGAVLWTLWSATDWSEQLVTSSGQRGRVGVAADRDLDAVVRLFDLAESLDSHVVGPAGALTWIRDLQKEDFSDSDVATRQRTADRDVVHVVTAHAAKGRQWPVVFVVGVQEGSWPDLRARPSLLAPERLSDSGIDPAPSTTELLEADRRLFYVALTRASEQLVVTAVSSSDPTARHGCEPSRFLTEIAASDAVTTTHVAGLSVSGLHLASLVAELRSTLESPSTSDALRLAAADRLATLRRAGVHTANPANWWGVRDWTQSRQPVRATDLPIRISGSSWESLERCSLRWFLEHEVKAHTPSGPATSFGTVVHAVADAIARGHLDPSETAVADELTDIWGSMGYAASWQAQAELDEALAAVRRFTAWQDSRPDRSVLGSEVKFEQQFDVGGEQVVVSGVVDRLETDDQGQLHIVDLKTQRQAVSSAQVAEHRQLSLYQVAAHEGAFAKDGGGNQPIGGAELVQLRVGVRGTGLPKVQQQGPVDPDEVRDSLSHAVKAIRNEDFSPNPSATQCRTCAFLKVCPAQVTQTASTQNPGEA